MYGQYFQREVGEWVINIMWVYQGNGEEGYIANVIMPEKKQVFGKQVFKTRAQALAFVKNEIDQYKKQCLNAEQCFNEILNDMIFDMQKEEEQNGN